MTREISEQERDWRKRNWRIRQMSPEQRLRLRGWRETTGPLETPCWEWNGSRSRGYGRIWVDGVEWKTHRLAYEVWVERIPDGMVVRHRCDNPPCVNPEHLEVGTHRDNSDDMFSRGRQRFARNEGHYKTGLTWGQVRDIRSRDLSIRGQQRRLAEEYGVSYPTINNILKGKTWKEN